MHEDCERCRQWIKDYLGGELDPSDLAPMEAHLEGCPACVREKADLERTLGCLRELDEEPVPRHFFVYEDGRGERAMRRWLSPSILGWKSVLAAVASVCALGLFLVVSQTTLEWGDGRVTLSFGQPPRPEETTAALPPAFMNAVQEAMQEEHRKWMGELRHELAVAVAHLNSRNDRAIHELAVDLELRLDQRLEAQDNATREIFQTALEQWGSALARQRQADLEQIQQALMQFAANDRFQAGRSTAILATLARIADEQDTQGGSR